MVKTGLLNSLLTQEEYNFEAYKQLLASNQAKTREKGLKATHDLLREVHAEKDINLALEAEHMLLRLELKNLANSKEETQSLNKSIEQIKEANDSLNIIQDNQSYQKAAKTYSGKNKEAGLPLDAMRQFIRSQSARLYNRMAGPLSVPEKNILRQRRENLGMVKELYIAMQREALGLPAPGKSQGLSR
jgi:hypothetical protein